MIGYQRFILDNGLEVLVHEDHSTEMAILDILYKVGSRNEKAGKTGLAHYFEHLMFGGSHHIPEFDRELEKVGGECNAFTNTDITNYYISLPAVNIETAFWLESDRMHYLNLSEKTIETQRNVVIEEFKQRYLSQPYGQAMHMVRDLAFQVHPYRWPTIGKEITDIENFTKKDVEDFYHSHYRPDNAILTVSGNVTFKQVESLATKWFSDIPAGNNTPSRIEAEPLQKEKRSLTVYADVPTDALYKVYPIPGRLMDGYLECDLITDILGFGRSSLLEQKLVKNTAIFASCSAFILGNVDPSLMVISGKMEKGHSAEEAEEKLDAVLREFHNSFISSSTLEKVKNQSEAMKTYESIQLINRTIKLAYYSHLGSPRLYQTEYEDKLKIKGEQILETAQKTMTEEKASVVYYKKQI